MVTTNLSPHQLFQRAQAPRISIARRLQALSLMARYLDEFYARATPAESALAAPASEVSTSQVAELLNAASTFVRAQLVPRLRRYRLRLAEFQELSDSQAQWLHRYFRQHIYPLLTPVAVDPGRPFPKLLPGRLYLLVVLQAQGKLGGEREIYGLVKMSNRMPRLVLAQGEAGSASSARRKATRPPCCLLWREDVIRHFIGSLFQGMTIKAVYQFRFVCATPPAAASAPDAATSRAICAPVQRVDVEAGTPPQLVQWLVDHLHTTPDRVLYCQRPLGMADLGEVADYLALMRTGLTTSGDESAPVRHH